MTSITMKEYFAEAGSRYKDKDAAIIGPVLDSLAENNALTPRDVVDAAMSTNSPLHRFFEWNDKKAADNFRLEQARNMLRSVQIRYIEDGKAVTARAFQTVSQKGWATEPREYRSFRVMDDDSAFAVKMMESAFDDLIAWRTKYDPYKGTWTRFAKVFTTVINQIGELATEIPQRAITVPTDDALAELLAWRETFKDALAAWTECQDQIGFVMTAISDAEVTFAKVTGIKMRKCILCSGEFKSSGAGHRMCSKCRTKSEVVMVSDV